MSRRTPRLTGVLVLALATTLAATAPAHAQDGGAGPARRGGVTLRVTGLTGMLLPGGRFRARLRVVNDGPVPAVGLRVLGTLHRRTITRFDYQQAVDVGRVGGLWTSFTEDVGAIEPGGSRTVVVERSDEQLALDSSGDYGVYPLRLQVQRDGVRLDEVTTSVVFSAPRVQEPLRVGLLLPVDEHPGRLASGRYRVDQLRSAVDTDGRLRGLVDGLLTRRGTPVTTAHSALLLEQLDAMADGFQRANGSRVGADAPTARRAGRLVRQVRALTDDPTAEQVALTYGPADLAALTRGGLEGEAIRSLTEANRTLESLTGNRPSPGVLWSPEGLDDDTLATMLAAGVDTVVLSDDALGFLRPPDEPFTPSPVRLLRTETGTTVTVLVPDPWLQDRLEAGPGEDGPLVAAQRLVGETAAVHFEQPYSPQRRGLLVAPPQLSTPHPEMVDEVARRLARVPWARQVTLSDVAAGVDQEPSHVRLEYDADDIDRELDSSYIASLRAARRVLGSLSSVLTPSSRAPDRYDRLLLQATSVHYRQIGWTRRGKRLVRAVRSAAAEVVSAVDVVQGPSVTLTSMEGQVPVTVRSTASVPLHLRVQVRGPRFRLVGPSIQRFTLRPGQSRTLAFRVRARTPGSTYPLQVLVQDPDATLRLAQASVVVRSTAYSVAALAVTAGAALFLLVWWLVDRRRRRGRARAERRRRRHARSAV
ncbi:hypothetical protein BH20ACT9_BH20ACT9_20350 [soil metagenome]